MFESTKRVALGAVVALPTLAVATSAYADDPTPPAPAPANNACVAHVQTVDEVQRGVPATVTCYPTFVDAMNAVGIPAVPGDTPQTIAARERAAAAAAPDPATTTGAMTMAASSPTPVLLSASYTADGVNNNEVPFSVYGTDCNGGGIDLASSYPAWDNVIGYTSTGLCSKIKHYDAPNFGSGAYQVVSPTSGLLTGAMHKTTSSIKYLG
jgi:hypothetical protein